MPIPGEPFRLSSAIYPEACVTAAASAYAEFCAVTLSAASADELVVTMRVAPAYVSKAQSVLDEFLNYTLDLSLRTHLGIRADVQHRGL